MASSGDQLFAYGITMDDSSSIGGSGEKRLQAYGGNLYYNGTPLTARADASTNFTAENNLYTSNIVYVDSANTVAIKFTNSNITLTSNLILGSVSSPPDAGSGLVAYDGSLYYNGGVVGASSNTFNVVETDLVIPKNTLWSNLIKLNANVQISEILWANSANITTTVDLDFDKDNPKIFHNSGVLSIDSISGESSLAIRSYDQSNVELYANTAGGGVNKSRLKFYGNFSSSETLLNQICSEAKDDEEGSTLIIQNVNPNDQSSLLNMIETYSNSTANVVALGSGTSDKVRVGIDATSLPAYKFTVGDGGTTKFAVDTAASKVRLASGIGLDFDGPINISQTGDKLQIGTTTTPGAESILIGPSTGTASTYGVVSIGFGAGTTGQTSNTTAIGFRAGQSGQKSQSTSLGYLAGQSNQNTFSVALGAYAGQVTQNTESVALGFKTGQTSQGSQCTAIGSKAGNSNQKKASVAIGHQAGQSSQDSYSVCIGFRAGQSNQNTNSVAIGYYAGEITQNTSSIAIGSFSGESNQGPFSISLGDSAGESQQSSNCIAIGAYAGQQSQKSNTISIGQLAGYVSQNTESIAIGTEAGKTSQNLNSVAIGRRSGYSRQNTYSIAIGYQTGYDSQGANTIAMGFQSGYTGQTANCIALGNLSGRTNQGLDSVAIGYSSGNLAQGENSLAVGFNAGQTSQGISAVALGANAGNISQNTLSVAIGAGAGVTYQGQGAIALGYQAGWQGQNNYSIAIGAYAGKDGQKSNSIVLNATGSTLNTTNQGFHVDPVRSDTTTTSNIVSWNSTTKEIVNTGALTVKNQNVGVGNTSPNHALSVNGAIYASNLIINNAITALGSQSSPITINMNNENYRTYSVSISSTNIVLNITNAIPGCQGIIYVTATDTASISTAASNQFFSTAPPGLSSGEKGVIAFTYDGTTFYISVARYTASGA